MTIKDLMENIDSNIDSCTTSLHAETNNTYIEVTYRANKSSKMYINYSKKTITKTDNFPINVFSEIKSIFTNK